MNLLITGANGFVGKAMLSQLGSSYQIYALVRDPDICKKQTNVHYITHDFSKRLDTKTLPNKIDAVVHLAQSNQYRNFPEGMRDMTDVNIAGLVDALDYARTADCQHFINFSSGSVYSTNPEQQTEQSAINPTSAYPLTKYISEQITALYSDFFTTLNLRLFFPYGPGQQDMLIPNITESIRSGKSVGLQGNNGGLKFCPIFINDVITITKLCLNKQTAGILNVAGSETISLQEVADKIGQLVAAEPIFEINAESVPPIFAPSLDKMHSLLGDKQTTSFADGIRKTIQL